VATRELLDSVFRGEVSTPEGAVEWLSHRD
jgi:hypothetical protein